MNKLSIKLKMSLWYGGLMALLLAISLSGAFFWLSQSIHKSIDNDLLDVANEVALDLTLSGPQNRQVTVEKDLSRDGTVVVMDTNDKVLFNDTKLAWATEKPYLKNKYWTKTVAGQQWRIYDAQIYNGEGKWVAIIRVFHLQTSTNEFLWNIALAMIIGGIVLVIFATLGGYLIARRSLAPISKITQTAREIEFGDLSKRIRGMKTHDEVGRLANTFNSMIESLEASFQREKLFASNASHELRTPVAVIMNTSEQLVHDSQEHDLETIDAYEMILMESRRMERIIFQLLSMANGHEGKYQLDIESIDLTDVVENVIAELKEHADNDQVTIIFDEPDRHLIRADQTLITQLLINLVENALKYSKYDGEAKITITDSQENVTVAVIDDGIGISQEDLPFIFDSFYRADKSRDRSGTGLGLAIAKWIVEAHQGSISVESEVDKGTTFTMVLKKNPDFNQNDAGTEG